MTLVRSLLLFLFAVSFASSSVLSADNDDQDGSRFDDELNERDWAALREFLSSKRTVDLKDKAENLVLSGDVRTEWRHMTETHDGRDLRGSGKDAVKFGSCFPVSKNDFDIEFNLRLDYTVDRTWAVAHIRYDNSAGIDGQTDTTCECDPYALRGSGNCDNLCLKKAYMGYNLYSECDTRFDIEIGRRGNLYNVFESNVQFLERLDGIVLNYASSWECFADFYWKWAGFVVDERVNAFAWATEIGFLNIYDTGFDFKYSYIDWDKNGRNRCWPRSSCANRRIRKEANFKFGCGCSCDKEEFLDKHLIKKESPLKYRISQFTLAYNINPDILCVPARLYGAFLINHAANKFVDVPCCSPINDLHFSDCSSSSSSSGSSSSSSRFVSKSACCDKCAKPGRQVTGFERVHTGPKRFAWYVGCRFGEVLQEGDWALDIQYQVVQANAIPDTDVSGISRGNVLDDSYTQSLRGNTNYKGWKIEGLYALTDDLSIDTILEASRAEDTDIGGPHSFSELQIQLIYAF